MNPSPLLCSAPDLASIAACWQALALPDGVHELRAPKTRPGPAGLRGVAAGYFNDGDAFAKAAASIGPADTESVYMTLNPVNPALLGRANNRLDVAKSTTSDRDIVCLRHLLIDVDPVRPSGISATDAERDAALIVRDQALAWLSDERGWPSPVAITASGNGGGLIYRLPDLPNDPIQVDLLRRTLAALAFRFSTHAVTIDRTTFNPARITKVIGTVAAKGDPLPDRPYRRATGLFPGDADPVPSDRLAAVAALAIATQADDAPRGSGASSISADVRDRLQARGIGFIEKGPSYATVLDLDRCLTSDDHIDGAAILIFPNGALAYRCHHDRCGSKGWSDVREMLGYRSRAAESTTIDVVTRSDADAGSAKSEPAWPTLKEEALHGLAGEVVQAVAPHTEGDPVAILVNLLTLFGCAIGRGPHACVGDVRHHANLFAVMVGATAKGRKGTAYATPERLLTIADSVWAGNRILGGLASGEGLIHVVRDPVERPNRKGEVIEADPGESDKRLLVVEEEFSQVLKVAGREGNTLSEVMRKAWDGKTLRIMTRNSPSRATDPHVAILGHITKAELLRLLDSTDIANGVANRFLWLCVRRSQYLPEGGRLPDDEAGALGRRIATALTSARQRGELRRDDAARSVWAGIYPQLSAERLGLAGAVASRAEAHVLRLQLLYALIDGADAIRSEHLLAALALWDYVEASISFIFGDALGDPVADQILAALRKNGPMTQSDLANLFGRHIRSERLGGALQTLLLAGKARSWREATGGRDRLVWAAT